MFPKQSEDIVLTIKEAFEGLKFIVIDDETGEIICDNTEQDEENE